MLKPRLATTVSKSSSIWPSVSFATATFNSGRTLEKTLISIKKQHYPAPVEIVIADGGSTDSSIAIAKKYGAKVIAVPIEKQNAEYNKGVAANQIKHEILAMVDHDNILPTNSWLKHMVQPLIDDPTIIGAGTFRFHHDRSMTVLDRYFALIGSPDPIPFFLNKSAHQSWLYNGFHLRGRLVEERPDYYVVELDPEKMPALGGNGCVLRRSLLKEAKSDPDNFFHIDIHVDLAKKGYRRYAFVKETIKHLTNNSILPFLSRRRYFIEKYHFLDYSRRRYSIYEPKKDKLALVGYIIYSATFIGPLTHATLGYFRRPDPAWFLHPIMCFAMLVVYGFPTVKQELRRVLLAR